MCIGDSSLAPTKCGVAHTEQFAGEHGERASVAHKLAARSGKRQLQRREIANNEHHHNGAHSGQEGNASQEGGSTCQGQARTGNQAPAKPAPDKVMWVASAKGRGGGTNARKVPFEARYGVDVADKDPRKLALQKGQIWRFFQTKEAAEKWAQARTVEGLDAIVVEATAKRVTK